MVTTANGPRAALTRAPLLARVLAVVLAVVLAGVLAAVLSGCGDGRTTGRELIQDDTSALVRAVNDGNATRARTALGTLEADIRAAVRLGQLEEGEARSLQALVGRVRTGLTQLAPRPTPTPLRTTAPRPPASGDAGDEGKGDGRKKRGKDD